VRNPWGVASLEWHTPDVPPAHGNWGDALPTVHRWAYDYSVPGAKHDFIPQHVAEENVEYEAGGRRVGEGE
jgi:cytochrome c oxidase subunit 1